MEVPILAGKEFMEPRGEHDEKDNSKYHDKPNRGSAQGKSVLETYGQNATVAKTVRFLIITEPFFNCGKDL
jgi:hypothetical protein